MPTRRVLTKDQLLSIASRIPARELTSEESEKFAIIEVGEPTPAPTRKETEPASNAYGRDGERAGGRHDRRGGGGRNRDDESRGGGGGNNNSSGSGGGGGRQHMYDRFAPPTRNYRNSGNRDAETFDEGYKYELEQKNAHMRQLNETIQREDKKGLTQAAEKMQANVDASPAAAASSASNSNANELDKLLAGIVTGAVVQEPTARRSRFFNSTETATPPPTSAPQMPAGSAWGLPSGTVKPFTTSSAAMAAPNAMQNAFTVAPANVSAGVDAGAMGAAPRDMGGMPGQQSNAHASAQATQLRGAPPTAGPTTTPNGVVRAEDIERMLKMGTNKSAAAATAPPVRTAQATKPASQGPIQASELESLLKMQAQRPAVSAMPMPLNPSPQHVQPASAVAPTAGMFTVNPDATNMRGMSSMSEMQQMHAIQLRQRQLQQMQQQHQQQQHQQQQQQQRAQLGGMPMNLATQNSVYTQQMAYPNSGFHVPVATYLRQQQAQQQPQQPQAQQPQARIGTFPTNPYMSFHQATQ